MTVVEYDTVWLLTRLHLARSLLDEILQSENELYQEEIIDLVVKLNRLLKKLDKKVSDLFI